jgi:hypothetical protein
MRKNLTAKSAQRPHTRCSMRSNKAMHASVAARAVAFCAALWLAGCASEHALSSRLDENGRTWLSVDAPVALARPAPRFSRAARDYLYVAPLETSSGGVRRQYLWVGLGTTVDRRWPWAAPPDAVTLLLTLDGTPLALPLEDWDSLQGAALYRPPAPVYDVRRASVTVDEVARIASAKSVEALVVAGDGSVAAYDLWGGRWSEWSTFVTDVTAPARSLGARR